MSFAGHLFSSLAWLFNMLFTIVYFVLIARILLSWFGVSPYNELVQIIYRISEPILMPLRRLPLKVGMIDFSPILAFILLSFLQRLVVGGLRGLALKFG